MPKQLIPNPNFAGAPEGWTLVDASKISIGQGNCIELSGRREGEEPSGVIMTLENVPTEHVLNFSCSLRRAEIADITSITITAYDAEKAFVRRWQSCWFTVTEKWTTYEAIFVAPSKTHTLEIAIHNFSETPALVRKVHLVVRNPIVRNFADGNATTVLEVNYLSAVCARPGETHGSVTFPIPGLYREQIPLSFEISSNPKSALKSYKIYPREDGINWLCQADLTVGQSVTINWKALVLVSGRKNISLRKTSAPPARKVTQWLRSTVCVQCDDAAIKKKAKALVNGMDDVETKVRKILEFVATQSGDGSAYESLDAKTALRAGGSCTSRANLTAALLRACGIAARTIAHIPVSSYWFDMHWLTEYWHPGHGWVWLETSWNEFEPAPNQLIVVAVATADDEDKSLDPVYLRTIMPGAAYLSTCLVSPELTLGYGFRQNFSMMLGALSGTDRQMEQLNLQAKRAFIQMTKSNLATANATRRTEEIMEAARSGKASLLSAALIKRNRSVRPATLVSKPN